jgi:EAL domain-containing protein (putative c-di-GMP-specific phosphodiesterase class I)
MNARRRAAAVRVGIEKALDAASSICCISPRWISPADARGAECLIRWQHRKWTGFLAHFIPVAEETGLIAPIDAWVLQEACRQLREWDKTLAQGVRVAVNISARQFRSRDVIDTIRRTVQEAGIEPQRLSVELTESAVMEETDSAARTLHRLKDMGVAIYIDDFGTGYSSLAYLKRFPIDGLKIDQTFVRDIAADPDDAAIVTAIITMAHSLKLTTIAEGVETAEQVDFLRTHGCEAAQGYLFSVPLRAEKLVEFLGLEGMSED